MASVLRQSYPIAVKPLKLRGRRGRFRRAGNLDLGLALALAQARRLADAIAQVIQLRAADDAGALQFDLADLRRVERESEFDAFALQDAALGEHIGNTFDAAGGDHVGDYL